MCVHLHAKPCICVQKECLWQLRKSGNCWKQPTQNWESKTLVWECPLWGHLLPSILSAFMIHVLSHSHSYTHIHFPSYLLNKTILLRVKTKYTWILLYPFWAKWTSKVCGSSEFQLYHAYLNMGFRKQCGLNKDRKANRCMSYTAKWSLPAQVSHWFGISRFHHDWYMYRRNLLEALRITPFAYIWFANKYPGVCPRFKVSLSYPWLAYLLWS